MRKEPVPERLSVVLADPAWKFDNRGSRASPDYNLKTGKGRRGDAAYGTMSLDDICAMNVEAVCDDDCLLGIWAPWAMAVSPERADDRSKWVPPATRVALSWGFRPVTAIPWLKGRWSTGDEVYDALQVLLKASSELDPTSGWSERIWDALKSLQAAERREREHEKPLVTHIGMGNYVRVATEILVLAVRGSVRIPPSLRLPGIIHPRTRHSAKPAIGRDLLSSLVPEGRRAELFAREAAPGWIAWGNEAPDADPWLLETI